ncbi:acyl-CoA dehydrogenase [Bradyrhizobium sp. SZCCHNRI1009]|uniref:acyl-CoA dehydrogenase n=1 Tax=Bradyrhizobium sp. SZCCHNRI1009 TaxID=3057277 RepID=UPI002915E26C|nr:acyl-CoA dehydrogenase [Bradyrhizobium sp. SZCCHNRI1009]
MSNGRHALSWRGDLVSGVCDVMVGAATADAFLVLLPNGRDDAKLALIERRHPGLSVEPISSLGLSDAQLARLRFDNCNLRQGVLLFGGAADAAYLASEVEFVLAACTAVVTQVDEAVLTTGKFAVERGLIEHQVVRHRLADLSAQASILRAFTNRTWRGSEPAHGFDGAAVRALAMLVAEQAQQIVDSCLQLFGGLGYMADQWICRIYRETRSLHLVLGRGANWESHSRPRNPSQSGDIDDFKRQVSDFIARRIAPQLNEWHEAGTVSRSMFEDFGSAGYLGLVVPRAMGGAGLDLRYNLALLEALMDWRMGSIAVSLMMPANTISPLLVRYATTELREYLLPRIIAGKMIPSLAITEPGGSSTMVRTLRTVAEDDGDHWIVSGEKIFITNGPIADVVFVLARTKIDPGPMSMTMIAVPTNTPGFAVVEHQSKLGNHISPTGRLRFEQCRVPKHFTVGLVHHGYAYFNDAISEERLLIAVGSVALALSCLSETAKRTGESAQGELALRAAHMRACRELCGEVADALCRGEQAMMDCWLAKFAVCGAATAAIECCARHLTDVKDRAWIEGVLCDARVLTIFAGASDVMRDLYSARLATRFKLMHRLGGEQR